MDLYFKFKEKSLPKIITKCINNIIFGPLYYTNDIYKIDQKYFRKLKLENIQNTISNDDKKLIEYLINTDFVSFISKDEAEKFKYRYSVGVSGSSGTMGTSGVSGISGISGCVGISGTSGCGIVFSGITTLNQSTLNPSVYVPPNIAVVNNQLRKPIFKIKIPFLSRIKKSVK